MIPSIYAKLFLLRPKVAKELLQKYILPLHFYGEICYVCFKIYCILLVIYLLRPQELQLPLSQNIFKYIFFHVHKIHKIFILYSIIYTLFWLRPLKLYRNESETVYSYFNRMSDNNMAPMIGEMDNAIKAVW